MSSQEQKNQEVTYILVVVPTYKTVIDELKKRHILIDVRLVGLDSPVSRTMTSFIENVIKSFYRELFS